MYKAISTVPTTASRQGSDLQGTFRGKPARRATRKPPRCSSLYVSPSPYISLSLTPSRLEPSRRAMNAKHYPSFTRVRGKDHVLWPLAVRTFEQRIAPTYGDQTKALKHVEHDSDRTLELMHLNRRSDDITRLVRSEIDGVLLFKNTPPDEFARHGLARSLEIKTLCLMPEAQNGRGGGRHLVERGKEVGRCHCNYLKILQTAWNAQTLLSIICIFHGTNRQ